MQKKISPTHGSDPVNGAGNISASIIPHKNKNVKNYFLIEREKIKGLPCRIVLRSPFLHKSKFNFNSDRAMIASHYLIEDEAIP